MYLVRRNNFFKHEHKHIKKKNTSEIISGIDKKGDVLDILISGGENSEENYFTIKSPTLKYEININNIYEVNLNDDLCACILSLKFDSSVSDAQEIEFKIENLEKYNILKEYFSNYTNNVRVNIYNNDIITSLNQDFENTRKHANSDNLSTPYSSLTEKKKPHVSNQKITRLITFQEKDVKLSKLKSENKDLDITSYIIFKKNFFG